MTKKIGRIFSVIIFSVIFNFVFATQVHAANANVTINSSNSTIVVGNNVTFTVTIQTSSPIGAWDYATSVSNNLTYVSGSAVSKSANLPSNSSTKIVTYTFTYRAKSSGTATFNFKLANVLDYATVSPMSFPSNTSKSITIITQAQLEASYSQNNNLASLSVEGYALSPGFNKNTLEYSVELPNEVTKIKINATKEDNTASIQGIGEKEVSEGINKFEIKVTAQNGKVKTYIINATVKELEPIVVNLNGEEFNVVRKKTLLTSPNPTFSETEIKINDLEVPAFENQTVGYTLVGLKDNEGNINLYIYDSNANTYKPYQEYNFKSSIICIINDESIIPKEYTKTTIKINEHSINAYQLQSNSEFYLFYGINLETGIKNLYVYDSQEETIQRYSGNEIKEKYQEQEKLYQYIIIGLGCFVTITYFILLVILITNSKKKKKMKMKKKSIKEIARPILDEKKDEKENKMNIDDDK